MTQAASAPTLSHACVPTTSASPTTKLGTHSRYAMCGQKQRAAAVAGDAGRGACRWWIGTRPTGTTSSPSTRSGLTPRRRPATPLAGTASTCGLNPTASSLMAPTLAISTRCEPRIGTLTARATTWCVAVAPWLMCCCRRRRACTSPTVLAAPVLWRLLGSRRRMHLSRTRRSRRVHSQERRHVPAACFCAG